MGEYFIYNIIFSGNDTSQFFLVLKVEIISTPVVVVVVVLEVEIISTLVAVVAVVGLCRGLGSSWSKRFYSAEVVVVGGVFRELSCSESVRWTTNCPLVLACCGLGTVVTFSGHFYTVVTLLFRIQSVFLISNKIHA
jgi:hypothetical protein